MIAVCLRVSSSSFRESSQAYQESFPRVGDEQEIEEGHPKEARRLQAPHLQNPAEFGKAIEEQIAGEGFMARGFHGRQERSHFRLRHRPTSIFPRQGNPRICQRGARPKATSRAKTQNTVTCQEASRICVSCHGAGRLTR